MFSCAVALRPFFAPTLSEPPVPSLPCCQYSLRTSWSAGCRHHGARSCGRELLRSEDDTVVTRREPLCLATVGGPRLVGGELDGRKVDKRSLPRGRCCRVLCRTILEGVDLGQVELHFCAFRAAERPSNFSRHLPLELGLGKEHDVPDVGVVGDGVGEGDGAVDDVVVLADLDRARTVDGRLSVAECGGDVGDAGLLAVDGCRGVGVWRHRVVVALVVHLVLLLALADGLDADDGPKRAGVDRVERRLRFLPSLLAFDRNDLADVLVDPLLLGGQFELDAYRLRDEHSVAVVAQEVDRRVVQAGLGEHLDLGDVPDVGAWDEVVLSGSPGVDLKISLSDTVTLHHIARRGCGHG